MGHLCSDVAVVDILVKFTFLGVPDVVVGVEAPQGSGDFVLCRFSRSLEACIGLMWGFWSSSVLLLVGAAWAFRIWRFIPLTSVNI